MIFAIIKALDLAQGRIALGDMAFIYRDRNWALVGYYVTSSLVSVCSNSVHHSQDRYIVSADNLVKKSSRQVQTV